MKIIALNQAYYFNINKITRSFFVCKIVYFEENIYNISPKSFFPFLKVAQLLMKSFLAMKSSIEPSSKFCQNYKVKCVWLQKS